MAEKRLQDDYDIARDERDEWFIKYSSPDRDDDSLMHIYDDMQHGQYDDSIKPDIHDDERRPWDKGPIKVMIGLIVAFMLISMSIPFYSIKADPEPRNIPSLDEVFPMGNTYEYGEVIYPADRYDYFRMIDGRDPAVKMTADLIASKSCNSYSKVCYAKAMFYFVRDEFQYVNDPSYQEYVKTARQSLLSRGGDCDDASVLLASLLRAVGIETRLVFIPGHVYVQALMPEAISRYKDGSDWVNLDATCRYCGFGELPR